MKQKIIFRADGATDFATKGTVPANMRNLLLTAAGVYTSARLTQAHPNWVAVSYASKQSSAWAALKMLLQAHSIVPKDDKLDPAAWHNESLLKFNTNDGALQARNAVNALLQLAAKVRNADTFTVDAQYAGGGKRLSATVGNMTVSYLIPYDSAKAAETREEKEKEATHKTTVAEEETKAAELENQTATYNQDTEEKKSQTAMSKTLRWVGIGTVGALIIGAVIFAVVKSKK